MGAQGRVPLLGVREAMARSFAVPASTPEAPSPERPGLDPDARPVLDELHAPATVRAGASLALKRVRALRGCCRRCQFHNTCCETGNRYRRSSPLATWVTCTSLEPA